VAIPRWMSVDTLQIRLSFFQQREQYTVVLIGNRVVNQDYQKVGPASRSANSAVCCKRSSRGPRKPIFEWDHWGTLRGQRVMAFQYHVRLDHSKYQLVVDDHDRIVAAYHGLVEVGSQSPRGVAGDHRSRKTSRPGFPVREARDVLDYDYTELSGRSFLLPLKSAGADEGNGFLAAPGRRISVFSF